MLPHLSALAYEALSTDHSVMAFDVRVSQTIFAGGELVARKEKARIGEQLAENDRELTRADIVFEVRRTFYEIKKAEAESKLAREELAAAEKMRDATQKLLTSEVEIQAKMLDRIADVAEREKNLLESDQNLCLLSLYLKQLTGIDFDSSAVFESLPNPSVEDEQSFNLKKELIRKLDLQVQEAEQDLKIAKSRRFPKAMLVSRYRKEEDSFYQKNAFEAGVMVQWNIWDFGETSSEIQDKRSKVSEAQFKKAAALQAVQFELNKGSELLLSKIKTIQISQKVLDAGQEYFKNIKTKHIQGDLSDLALDAARVQLLRVETALEKSRCDYWLAEAEALRLAEKVQGDGEV